MGGLPGGRLPPPPETPPQLVRDSASGGAHPSGCGCFSPFWAGGFFGLESALWPAAFFQSAHLPAVETRYRNKLSPGEPLYFLSAICCCPGLKPISFLCGRRLSLPIRFFLICFSRAGGLGGLGGFERMSAACVASWAFLRLRELPARLVFFRRIRPRSGRECSDIL